MRREDYQEFRAFLADTCGLILGDDKQYLVSSRLSPLMLEFSIVSVRELIDRLRRDRRASLMERVIDAMTASETRWFREPFAFETLKQTILPGVAHDRGRPVRIWSAGCSSGQEAYSIAMSVHEYSLVNPGALPAGTEILATDISPALLKQAALGLYDGVAITRGLTGERRQRYFVPQGSQWVIKPEIRQLVSFREVNLCEGYESLGRFDAIFCRNVLVYFALAVRRDILTRMGQVLHPGGYLLLGASESIADSPNLFETLPCDGGVVHRLKDQSTASQISP
jgi:chemotaxis protein methyltransferase CheR